MKSDLEEEREAKTMIVKPEGRGETARWSDVLGGKLRGHGKVGGHQERTENTENIQQLHNHCAEQDSEDWAELTEG